MLLFLTVIKLGYKTKSKIGHELLGVGGQLSRRQGLGEETEQGIKGRMNLIEIYVHM